MDCATLLGVEIDSKLSFNEHNEKVCIKLASGIAILRKIRACLPLKQRLQFYNSIIRPVMSCTNVVWANCDKESVYRGLRLQKRAAHVISYVDRMTPSVALFNKLGWIPFYEQHKIDKYTIMYKRINASLPFYLNEHLILIISGAPATLDIQALMLFVLNTKEKQREDALSLFRKQDCGTVYQLKLGN